MAMQGKSAGKLVGVIFTPIGLGLLGFGGWSANRQYTILKYWPTVEGQVVTSRLTHHVSHDSESNSDTDSYGVEVVFRYTANGKEYVTPSDLGYTSSSYSGMRRLADSYAPGARRVIKYNPADPNDIRFNAAYTFGFFFLPLVLGGMGVVFAGLGIGILVAFRPTMALLCPSCGQPIERGQKFCPNCASPLHPS